MSGASSTMWWTSVALSECSVENWDGQKAMLRRRADGVAQREGRKVANVSYATKDGQLFLYCDIL